jgi:hypothetical protein
MSRPTRRPEQTQNESAEYTACRQCGQPIPYRGRPGPRGLYCSHACRQAAYRDRLITEDPAPTLLQLPPEIERAIAQAASRPPPYTTGTEDCIITMTTSRGHTILHVATPLRLSPPQVTMACSRKTVTYTSYRDDPDGTRHVFVSWKSP